MKWCSVLVVLFCVGCSDGTGVKTVRVSGVVKLDGQPLADAEVHFVGPKHAGFGKTDAEGKFKLVTGAEPGENKVFFRKESDDKFSKPEEGLDAGQAAAAAAAQRNSNPAASAKKGIPAEYTSSGTTKLTFTVPEGGSDSANFELDSAK
ncbi:MAG: hypothetical protein U0939_09835 [Pirellulales bacterium]